MAARPEWCLSRRPSFNGAAAFRPRMAARPTRHINLDAASMGPQPSGRGWTVHRRRTRGPGCRFNGAAAFRPRMVEFQSPVVRRVSQLQWGRSLPAADGFVWNQAIAARALLQWGRSLPAAYGPARRLPSNPQACFNGAAAFRPRMEHARTDAIAGPRASMGPQPSGRGWTLNAQYGAMDTLLQWGRSLPAADGPCDVQGGSGLLGFNGAAAFRPRMAGKATEGSAADELQWGRSLPAADGCEIFVSAATASSFNGAAAFRPRMVCAPSCR